ncbi:hypothetical protein [Paenibacillus xylaniclasticus]|uniref:hypothetical protein n=1 Tax=Paenibacillus xylaniclasticus TaxID=588083 RepID=UPI0013DFC961|nr:MULTISPECIES: hypothetical protein [Paenibacillus]GFN30650.1 hypothetical protein PCURB6_09100 [Paenibacillus curdlanolyticus]
MDKRKAIAAYRRGWLTLHECAQILGIHSEQLRMIADSNPVFGSSPARTEKVTSYR